MLDSLVRVSRRVAEDHYAKHPSPKARSSVGAGGIHPGYNTPREEPHSRDLYPAVPTDAGPEGSKCTAQKDS